VAVAKLNSQFLVLKGLLAESQERLSASEEDWRKLEKTFNNCQQTKNAIKWSLCALKRKKDALEEELSTVSVAHDNALLENQSATESLEKLRSEFEENDKLLNKCKSKRDSMQLQVFNNNKEIELADQHVKVCKEKTQEWVSELGKVEREIAQEKHEFNDSLSNLKLEVQQYVAAGARSEATSRENENEERSDEP